MKAWIHSIVAAAIAAFATSVTAAFAAPDKFNFSAAGLEHILAVGGLSALLAVLALLRQSPLPPTSGTQAAAGSDKGANAALLLLAALCLAPLAQGCKAANAKLPPWAVTPAQATVGSVLSSAVYTVNGYEADKKACAADPSLAYCGGVADSALKAAVQDIQKSLVVAKPTYDTWQAALKTDPKAAEPAALAAAVTAIQTALANMPALAK